MNIQGLRCASHLCSPGVFQRGSGGHSPAAHCKIWNEESALCSGQQITVNKITYRPQYTHFLIQKGDAEVVLAQDLMLE